MASLTLPPIPERVARGAQLLDTHQPGWAEQVNLDHLNEAYGTNCVLGQLYDGSYLDGSLALHRLVADLDEAVCGFDIPADHDRGRLAAAYAQLTKAWHAEITTRRNGGGAR